MPDRVPPVVDLLFACEDARYDEQGDVYTVVNPLGTTVVMPAGVVGNFVLEELVVFAQALDAVGEFQFRVEVRDEAGLRVARSPPQGYEFDVNERLFAKQLVFRIADVEFSKPGAYQIVLMVGEKEIGRRLLRVLPGE